MSENKESKNGYGVLIGAVSTVVILWTANWVLLWKFGNDNAERGQFGDMFGSVNALFSGLAFAFLIYTIWLQREELKLQREELKLQRYALELQAEELKRQADELAKTAEIQAKTFELQKLQIEFTQKQTEEEKRRFEKQNSPNFISDGRLSGSYNAQTAKFNHQLVNTGGPASQVKIENSKDLKQSGQEFNYVGKNGGIDLNWDIQDVPNFPSEVEFQITFYDQFGKEHKQSFKLINDKNKTNESEKFKIISN